MVGRVARKVGVSVFWFQKRHPSSIKHKFSPSCPGKPPTHRDRKRRDVAVVAAQLDLVGRVVLWCRCGRVSWGCGVVLGGKKERVGGRCAHDGPLRNQTLPRPPSLRRSHVKHADYPAGRGDEEAARPSRVRLHAAPAGQTGGADLFCRLMIDGRKKKKSGGARLHEPTHTRLSAFEETTTPHRDPPPQTGNTH